LTTKAPPEARPRPTERAQAIDPRIRARRIEVRRTEARRRLHRLSLLGAAAAVLVGAWWLTLTPLLDVDHVRVEGADHTGAGAVRDAIDIHRGDALLTADIGGAARLLSKLPWVATAQVRRSWPGTVSITVVERLPVAAIAATTGGWVVVDGSGRQLATQKEPALDLVRIAGRAIVPDLGAAAGERYRGALDLAAAIPPSLRGAVASLWPQRDGSLESTVTLPGGATAVARFGVADQLEAKLVALAAVLERADLDRVRLIDLRVPGAPALTRA
jgi:cell division protein FtsQ